MYNFDAELTKMNFSNFNNNTIFQTHIYLKGICNK